MWIYIYIYSIMHICNMYDSVWLFKKSHKLYLVGAEWSNSLGHPWDMPLFFEYSSSCCTPTSHSAMSQQDTEPWPLQNVACPWSQSPQWCPRPHLRNGQPVSLWSKCSGERGTHNKCNRAEDASVVVLPKIPISALSRPLTVHVASPK